MDILADGRHVRLRSGTRGIERFLYAVGDWMGVSVLPLDRIPFRSTVWRVRHQVLHGNIFLIFQGAYGRYLAVSLSPSPPPLRGRAPIQLNFHDRHVEPLLWTALRVQSHASHIRIRHFHGYLQATRSGTTVSPSFTDTEMQRALWVVEAVEAASAPARPLIPNTVDAAMDLFPDGAFVQLRCLARRGRPYLYADPDSRAVSLRPRGRVPFESTVWRVHHWHRDRGTSLLMLQGAAYGNYLGAVSGLEGTWAPSQCSYETEDAHQQMWVPVEVTTSRGGIVRLRNVRYGYLWHGEACMYWVVDLVATRPTRPPLPPADPSDKGSFNHSFQLQKEPMLLQRTIRFVVADSEGTYSNTWEQFCFSGSSIVNLMSQVQDRMEHPFRMLLCVHSGCFGRLSPLVNNLPRNTHTMDIVVLQASSPAAARLRYPLEDPSTPEHKVL